MENVSNHDIKMEYLEKNILGLKIELDYARKEIEKKIENCKKSINEDNKDTTERFLIAKKLSKKIYLEYSSTLGRLISL